MIFSGVIFQRNSSEGIVNSVDELLFSSNPHLGFVKVVPRRLTLRHDTQDDKDNHPYATSKEPRV